MLYSRYHKAKKALEEKSEELSKMKGEDRVKLEEKIITEAESEAEVQVESEIEEAIEEALEEVKEEIIEKVTKGKGKK